jgi:hypothetical protein
MSNTEVMTGVVFRCNVGLSKVSYSNFQLNLEELGFSRLLLCWVQSCFVRLSAVRFGIYNPISVRRYM